MIKLLDNLYIDADVNQYILKNKTNTINKSTGESIYKVLGYYSDVSGAVLGASKYLFRKQVQSNDLTLKEAENAFKAIENDIQKSVKI